jgi:hypothetical protein
MTVPLVSARKCVFAPDALAEALHAVLKKANYKEIPQLPTCCRFSLC